MGRQLRGRDPRPDPGAPGARGGHRLTVRVRGAALSVRSAVPPALVSGAVRLRHVAINAVFLQPAFGGLETYVKRLMPEVVELAPNLRISVFVNRDAHEWLREEPWAGSVRLVSHPLLGRRYARAASEVSLLAPLASRDGADLIYSAAM